RSEEAQHLLHLARCSCAASPDPCVAEGCVRSCPPSVVASRDPNLLLMFVLASGASWSRIDGNRCWCTAASRRAKHHKIYGERGLSSCNSPCVTGSLPPLRLLEL